MKNPDDEQRLTDGYRRWHETARGIVSRSRLSGRRFATKHGMSDRTLSEAIRPDNPRPPTLTTVFEWHLRGTYPAVEQIRDLFGLDEHDLDVRMPLWRPKYATEHLIEGIRNALRWSASPNPSIYEFAEHLNRSCQETGDAGRWRTRLFDIPIGWDFPHVGYQAIEFLRWYGPNAGVADDPHQDRAAEFLGLDSGDPVGEPVPAAMRRPDPPATFRPELIDTTVRKERWDQFRFERGELHRRLALHLNASNGTWYGGYGTAHVPLLRHPENSTGRHIYTIPFSPVDRSREPHQPPVPATGQGIKTILLLGTGAVNLNYLGQHVAESLGWEWVNNRDLAHRLSGRRTTLSGANERTLDAQVYEQLAYSPLPHTIATLHLGYMMDETTKGAWTTRLAAAEHLLGRPEVLPVLVLPRYDSQTLPLWEQRQRQLAVAQSNATWFNTVTEQRRLANTWFDFLSDTPRSLLAEVQPSLPWAAPTNQGTPDWFQHPLLGDLSLRISYELAHHLTTRTADGRRVQKRGATPRFSPGSIIATYQDALARCTGGEFWTNETHLQDRSRYAYAHVPGSDLPRARCVRFELLHPTSRP